VFFSRPGDLTTHITNIVPDQTILDKVVQRQNKIIVIQ